MTRFALFLLFILASHVIAREVLAQTIDDVESVKPYVWEIMAIAGIFVSLTITQWIKKRRWFPKFLCDIKLSKSRNKTQYEYKQLKGKYLDFLAVSQTFVYVSGCLYVRYLTPLVLVVGFFACVLQWKLIKLLFLKAKQKEGSEFTDILRGELYVPEDAPMMTKIAAIATGGGVDKYDKTRVLTPDEIAEITKPK